MIDTHESITIIDRKSIELIGVCSVESFDEYLITLKVSRGLLSIEGEGLKIATLDLEKGRVFATGSITGVFYSDEGKTAKKGTLSKFFGKHD